MISCEPDPDVVRWGLNLLDGDPSSHLYCMTAIQNDGNSYDGEYSREGHFCRDRTTVENDEIIALALQEEFSQLAVAEASGSSGVGDGHLEASILAQDWLGPSRGSSSSGNENGQEEAIDMDPPSSCSSPEEKSYDGEEWNHSLELTDFSVLDGEVGKRLNQMVPIPHVPRINGEIPSVDESTSDHHRLLDRLRIYDLVELKVQGDGNCQLGVAGNGSRTLVITMFRALSDQFYRTPEHHEFVRQQVVNQLKSHPEIYEGYVPMAYSEYLKKISEVGEWGDHVTLQAASDRYGVKIFVITSFKDTCYIEILPNVQKSKRVVFLSFWAEVHYNSIYPEGGDDATGIVDVKDHLAKEFHLSDLGKLKFFLGIEVERSSRDIYLCQRKQTLDLLNETGMLGVRRVDTPMECNIALNIEEGELVKNPEQYRRLVGKLIYLTITRPDICYAVGIVSQFMNLPREPHLHAVYKIMKYLESTPGKGILLSSQSKLEIKAYSDAD